MLIFYVNALAQWCTVMISEVKHGMQSKMNSRWVRLDVVNITGSMRSVGGAFKRKSFERIPVIIMESIYIRRVVRSMF